MFKKIIINLYNKYCIDDRRNKQPWRLFILKGWLKTIELFKNKRDRKKILIRLANKWEHKIIFTMLNREKRYFKIDLEDYKRTHKGLFNNIK